MKRLIAAAAVGAMAFAWITWPVSVAGDTPWGGTIRPSSAHPGAVVMVTGLGTAGSDLSWCEGLSVVWFSLDGNAQPPYLAHTDLTHIDDGVQFVLPPLPPGRYALGAGCRSGQGGPCCQIGGWLTVLPATDTDAAPTGGDAPRSSTGLLVLFAGLIATGLACSRYRDNRTKP